MPFAKLDTHMCKVDLVAVKASEMAPLPHVACRTRRLLTVMGIVTTLCVGVLESLRRMGLIVVLLVTWASVLNAHLDIM